MRNRLFLLTAAVVLSACADDQHATAPASHSGLSGRSASGDVAPSGGGIKLPDAKPAAQVGFTKITRVTSAQCNVVIGENSSNTATCSAGTTAIGGNYNISLFVSSASFPWFRFAGLDGQNGWSVTIWNEQAGAREFSYYVTAYCAS